MAIAFAGGTDRVAYPNNGWGVTSGCFAFRLKTTQTTANAVPVSVWSASSRTGFGFIINNTLNKITAQGYDGSAVRINITATTSINDGNWHHIAFNLNVANGGANALFIDGVSEATGNSSAVWSVSSTVPPYLGDNNDTFWPSYVGDLAELAEWNRQLDAAEIAALANGFSPARIASNILKFHAPLVRSANNRFDAPPTSITGTTVSVHPRVVGGPV